jgi:hypothetical protein
VSGCDDGSTDSDDDKLAGTTWVGQKNGTTFTLKFTNATAFTMAITGTEPGTLTGTYTRTGNEVRMVFADEEGSETGTINGKNMDIGDGIILTKQ